MKDSEAGEMGDDSQPPSIEVTEAAEADTAPTSVIEDDDERKRAEVWVRALFSLEYLGEIEKSRKSRVANLRHDISERQTTTKYSIGKVERWNVVHRKNPLCSVNYSSQLFITVFNSGTKEMLMMWLFCDEERLNVSSSICLSY